jgi:hypothetical protein
MNTKPNRSNSTKNGDPNANVAEITFMDLAVLGAQSEGLTSEDLDNVSGEQLWRYVEIADRVIYNTGFSLLFGIEFHPKEEIPYPWTEQEAAEHNTQAPLPCHVDEL